MKNSIYGWVGFLSLLGILGLFTREYALCGFFGFAVHFQYFFIKSDEMLVSRMNGAAAHAFIGGMLVTAAVTLLCYFTGTPVNTAFSMGLSLGWGASVAYYSVALAYHGFRESMGESND